MVQSAVLFSQDEIASPVVDEDFFEDDLAFIDRLQQYTGRTDEMNQATADYLASIAPLIEAEKTAERLARGSVDSTSRPDKSSNIYRPLFVGVAAATLLVGAYVAYEKSTSDQVPVTRELPDIIQKDVPTQLPAPEAKKVEALQPIEFDNTVFEIVEAQMSDINTLRPSYEVAAEQTGVPWELIATLHYREASNDPTRSIFAGEILGSTNPDHHEVMPTDLVQNYTAGAEHFKANAQAFYSVRIGTDNTPEELMSAFLAYNRGHMYLDHGLTPYDSPYVVSGLNSEVGEMIFPNSPAETVPGFREDRAGAFPFYVALRAKTSADMP